MNQVSALHVFDLDGTLLRGTTASLEIAKTLGMADQLHQLETAFAMSELDTKAFAAALGHLWQGLDHDTVSAAFRAAPFIDGITQVLTDISSRGEYSVLITMSPDFFAHYLQQFGFDHVIGSAFPQLPLSTPPDPSGILIPENKVTITDRLLNHYELERIRCVAYGDSGSDIPLFTVLEHTIAVNATDDLERLSRFCYRGDDLWGAYQHARTAIDTQPHAAS